MSRSIIRTPIYGHTKRPSEKKDKRYANRSLRRTNRVLLQKHLELKTMREVSDVWGFSKDGKTYCTDHKEHPEYWRK